MVYQSDPIEITLQNKLKLPCEAEIALKIAKQ